MIQGLLLGPALMWTLARTYMLNVAGFTKYLIVITMFTFIQLVDVEALDKMKELALYQGQSSDFLKLPIAIFTDTIPGLACDETFWNF